MSSPTLEDYLGPDPDDSRGGDEFAAITGRIRNSSITEPFAEGYQGEVTPRDLAMREMLGRTAAERAFDAVEQTRQRASQVAGHIMSLHYNPDTVQWN